MRAVLAILRREVQACFVSPVAYVFMVAFLGIMAYGFNVGLQFYARMPPLLAEQSEASLRTHVIGGPRGIIGWAQTAILLSLPGLSMRLFSEERRSGTIELLLTSPLTPAQLVAGKFLGALAVFACILVLTLPLVGVVAWKGDPEWGPTGTAYAGIFLFGAVVLAMGVFASALTESQFVALVVTYTILTPLLAIRFLVGMLGNPWDDILMGLSLRHALRQFGVGLVDTHYLVLFGTLMGGFLFLTARVLDSRRWS